MTCSTTRRSVDAEPSDDDNWPAVLQRTYYETQHGKALPDAVARIRYKEQMLEVITIGTTARE